MSETEQPARRRPGPAPAFSREQVIATGLEILARDGIRAVSFRTVALRLGVAPNALYTYLADKDDLMAGMLEATLRTIDLPAADDPRPAVEQLVSMMHSLRSLLIENSELFNLAPTSTRPLDDAASAFDRIWTALTAVVADDVAAAGLYASLLDLTVGSAMNTARGLSRTALGESAVGGLDEASHGRSLAMNRAAGHIDREQLFDRSLRVLLNQDASR